MMEDMSRRSSRARTKPKYDYDLEDIEDDLYYDDQNSYYVPEKTKASRKAQDPLPASTADLETPVSTELPISSNTNTNETLLSKENITANNKLVEAPSTGSSLLNGESSTSIQKNKAVSSKKGKGKAKAKENIDIIDVTDYDDFEDDALAKSRLEEEEEFDADAPEDYDDDDDFVQAPKKKQRKPPKKAKKTPPRKKSNNEPKESNKEAHAVKSPAEQSENELKNVTSMSTRKRRQEVIQKLCFFVLMDIFSLQIMLPFKRK